MKHLLISTLFSACLLAACNSDKTKDTKTDETKTETSTSESTTSDNSAVTSADEAQKKMDELKKLPVLTTDQIKALLPTELNGMKRTSFSANSMAGYGVGQAEYKGDEGKEMRLVVYDCAGEAGAGWYNMMYWAWNMEQEDENGYQKTTKFNGSKAIEKYEKGSDKYSIIYAASDRLLVSLEGEKTGLDAVKSAANSLDLKTN